MKKGVARLCGLLFPRVSGEVQKELDKQAIKNVMVFSAVIFIAEVTMLLLFLPSLPKFDGEDLIRIGSVAFCVLVSGTFWALSFAMRRKKNYRHVPVLILCVSYFVLTVLWSGWVSYRHYMDGDQMLAFFTVLTCFVCFLSFRPLLGGLLVLSAYTGLYMALFFAEGATRITLFNYVMFAVVSAAAVIMRYYQQLKISRRTAELKASNDQLQYVSRHDPLSGLRNRTAYAEDFPSYAGKSLKVILTDIDYFKEVNDTYGHIVGDNAITAAGAFIRQRFPTAHAYRYGGDEFLIILDDETTIRSDRTEEELQSFSLPVADGDLAIRLSFGTAEGTPRDPEGMTALIAEADRKLYAIKKEIHKND